MWKEDNVEILPEKIKDEDLGKAKNCGRVEKYLMDVGWEKSYRVYPVYGKSGGSREVVAITEAILQAATREI